MHPLHLQPYLNRVITDVAIDLPNRYSGKVRENFDLPDGRRIIVATDRLSAFDRNVTAIPFKGEILTKIARYWFDQTQFNCPNHILGYPDPNTMVVERLDMLPVEIVVRDYLTGSTDTSILTMYKAGQRQVYGYTLPDGLLPNQKLPETLITPTTKGAVHDEPLTSSEIVERGLLTAQEWDEVTAKAIVLFTVGRRIALEHGMILADTKYEFGRNRAGIIVVGDEIHTPDSSRYWLADSYQRRFEAGEPPISFDKDVIRRWIGERCDPYNDPIPAIPAEMIAETAALYINILGILTGKDFLINPFDTDPTARVLRNVQSYIAGQWDPSFLTI